MNIRFEKLTSREADGGVQLPGSSDAGTQYKIYPHAVTSSSPASVVSSPWPDDCELVSSGTARFFIQAEREPVQPLRSRPYLLQLALDVLALALCIVFLCVTAASIPLALFLMIFASF